MQKKPMKRGTPTTDISRKCRQYRIRNESDEERQRRLGMNLWQVSKVSQLQYYLVKILQDNACFTRPKKKQPKIPIFRTLTNNENFRNFEGKNHGLMNRILEELLYLRKVLLF